MFKKIKLFKLNQSGVAHLLYPILGLAVVAVIAGAGFYVYQQNKSGAGSLLDAVPKNNVNGAVPIKNKCPKGMTIVTARPSNFARASDILGFRNRGWPMYERDLKYQGLAASGMGTMCLKRSIAKADGYAYLKISTIKRVLVCPKNTFFAYDKNKEKGTGADGGNKWAYKDRWGRTYYCVPIQDIGQEGFYDSLGIRHPYKWVDRDLPNYQTGYESYAFDLNKLAVDYNECCFRIGPAFRVGEKTYYSNATPIGPFKYK